MSREDDIMRAYEYGKTEYYQAIQGYSSYQKELERVRRDYNERTWIDFKGFWPKFTTEEFEKRRIKYQAKYGNTINIPGFSDVIHIIPQAGITPEERASHLWATRRGYPSPLTPAQRQTMQYKKFRFLKALASPTPAWMKTYGAVATALDNIEDALVTIVVAGRIAAKIAPRLLGRLVPGLGWLLLGSDVINAANIMSYTAFAAKGGKRNAHALTEKNPFHAKAAARRTLKLQRTIPTFGETLEILQTTDQLFGVGLCLGGLMGLLTDTISTVFDPNYWLGLNRVLTTGNVSEIATNIAGVAMSDYKKIKKALQEQWTSFKDESYRLKATDIKLRQSIFDWIKNNSDETWGWIKSKPGEWIDPFTAEMMGSMILSTGKDDFLKEDHTKSFMMLNSAIQGLMPWWFENDPLTNFKDLRTWEFRAPGPKDQTTIDMLTEHSPKWQETIKWPHLDKKYATIEEITFAYAPMIKDSFQTYALKYAHEYEAMIAAQQVVEFIKNVIKSFSDDGDVRLGLTSYAWVAEDMMREIYLIPPDTPDSIISALADYVGNYERQTGGTPKIHEVARYGESIGIEWMRTFPKRAFDQAADIFPEWQAIQDQIDELFISD